MPPLNGWLIIDKPGGMTSAQVVGRLKKYVKPSKIGHAGTLDPMATGILPLAIGEATKTVQYCMDKEKSYAFTVTFGAATDTDDAEGETIETSKHVPDDAAIQAILPQFIGHIQQAPPIYSAIKVAGQRAYDLARKGDLSALPTREVRVDDLQMIERISPTEAAFTVDCGRGTYVRSLARDIAKALGSCGHISALRRTKVGIFDESCAISLDFCEELLHSARPSSPDGLELYAIDAVLDDIPVLHLSDDDVTKVRHGNPIQTKAPQGLVRLYDANQILALAESNGSQIQPVRVFSQQT